MRGYLPDSKPITPIGPPCPPGCCALCCRNGEEGVDDDEGAPPSIPWEIGPRNKERG